MNLVFMGTPAFAEAALRALHRAGHRILAVYSQPPRPAGRGHAPQRSAVHGAAGALGIPVRTPATLRDPAEVEHLKSLAPDAIVVAAYGLILPKTILALPPRGCLNIHASLLPRWRGAAPIQHALLAGDNETGVGIMQMEAGLDTGPVLLQEKMPIGPRMTAPELYEALTRLGARLIVEALEELEKGALTATPQSAEGVTYARKLAREDGALDWTQPAALLDRQVRALTPWPGTFFSLKGEAIKVLEAEPLADPPAAAPPGTLLDDAGAVACGTGALRLLALQRPGRRALPAAETLQGLHLKAGDRLSG